MRTRVTALMIKNGRILLIHRRKKGREYWAFPGGGVEDGETKEEAMVREVKEETGLDATNVRPAFGLFYYCDVAYEQPVLGGPEKIKMTEDNWYQPEWVELIKARDLDIYPVEGRKVFYG